MPYKLRKAPRRNLYWVVSKDTGEKHSKDPLPMERAKAQMRALYANVADAKMKGGIRSDQAVRQLAEEVYESEGIEVPLQEFIDGFFAGYRQHINFTHRGFHSHIPPNSTEAFRYGYNYGSHYGGDDRLNTVHSDDSGSSGDEKSDYDDKPAKKAKKGSGFLGDAWSAVSDKVDKAKKAWKDKGMATLTGTNYTGAWNRLDDEYLRTHPPTDVIDKGALEHDLEYSRLAKLRKEGKTSKAEIDRMIRESDDKFLQNIRDNWKANPWASALGYAGIKGKNVAEDTVGLDKNLFVGEGLRGGIHSRSGVDITIQPNRSLRIHIVGNPGIIPLDFIIRPTDTRNDLHESLNYILPPADEQLLWEDIEGIREGMRQMGRLEEKGIVDKIMEMKGTGKKGGFMIMKGRPQDQPYYKEPVKYGRPQDQPYYQERKRDMVNREGMEKLDGSGFFGDIWNSAKSVANRVVKGVKDVAMGFRNDFSPSVRGLLGFIGDKPITQMFVRRDPIQSALNTALNFISLGKWNEVRNKYGFDKFFHLRLEVIIRVSESPVILAKYTLEKNEVINIQKAFPIESETEVMPVEMKGEITVNQLLQGAKQIQGDTFHKYDAFHNNCQDFVGAMLQSNGLLTPDVAEFIKQDIRQAISELPSWTGKIARGLTDAGALANVALEGRGGIHPMAKFAKQMESMGVNPAQYLALAKKKAKALGLADNMLGFSTDAKHKLQIPNNDGKMIRFGAVGLGDYILYSLSGDKKADQHRSNYRKRATKIKGDWEKDPYSANNLAIGVLW